jgi:hypothetical protein
MVRIVGSVDLEVTMEAARNGSMDSNIKAKKKAKECKIQTLLFELEEAHRYR